MPALTGFQKHMRCLTATANHVFQLKKKNYFICLHILHLGMDYRQGTKNLAVQFGCIYLSIKMLGC
jgi:hypothetical protein